MSQHNSETKKHLICLTLDTDPDGLSLRTVNRADMRMAGLAYVIDQWQTKLDAHQHMLPMTWFVRADTQIEEHFGSQGFLFEHYTNFWQLRLEHGDEIGWHPHVYEKVGADYRINKDTAFVKDALSKTWDTLQAYPYHFNSFRMGEGWHTPESYAHVESFGISVDSTIIPNRHDEVRQWRGTPNHPYYPAYDDIRQNKTRRPMIEMPMNTWHFSAPYDDTPRLRYMNPAIHPSLWQQATHSLTERQGDLSIWVFVVHPNEIMPNDKADALYAHNIDAHLDNIQFFANYWRKKGDTVEFRTIHDASTQWIKTFYDEKT